MGEVTAVRTPASMGDIHQSLLLAWQSLRGEYLTPKIAALLLALVDLETGTGSDIENWNLGNLVSTSDEQSWFAGIDTGNARRFRAFGSLLDGAKGLVKQLTSDTRVAWRNGLLSGNPHRFVEALGGVYGGPKYFEANLDRYRKAFLQRWARYEPAEPITARPPRTRSGAGAGLALLLLGGIGVAAALYWGTK